MKTSWFQRVLLLVLSFAFIGGLVAALLAPRLITWYAEPAVDIGINCASTAAWATATLLKFQLWGCGIGVVLGLLLLVVLARRNKSKDHNLVA